LPVHFLLGKIEKARANQLGGINMRGGKIFISYRRSDSPGDSGRLFDRLNAIFPGAIFMDVTSIEPGVEWDDEIARFLSQTDACIVVIGKGWLNATDEDGHRRLDNPHDVVREEIAAVLRRKLRVVPVLVGGASMPAERDLPDDLKALCRRHAIELNPQHWNEGVQRLLQALEAAVSPSGQPQPKAPHPPANRLPLWLAGAGVLLVAIAGGVWYSTGHSVAAPDNANATTSNSAASFAGNWRAVINTSGQRLDEDLEIYPDHSLRFLAENTTAAVGKWQYDSGTDSLEATDATNLKDNVQFSCTWKNAGTSREGLSGVCRDRSRNSWTISLSQAPGSVSESSFVIPRLDLSSLTTAERAAFSQSLSTQRCTCGMTLLTCLRKHPACPYKIPLAQSALQAFVLATRR
jgi:hypothetical protein